MFLCTTDLDTTDSACGLLIPAVMFSMFNSPLPSMRQTTTFYHTDLKVQYIRVRCMSGCMPMRVWYTMHRQLLLLLLLLLNSRHLR